MSPAVPPARRRVDRAWAGMQNRMTTGDAAENQRRDGGGQKDDAAPESTRTVIVAVLANLGIAVAKLVAALMTGSAALWAETAHSVADTGNEVLLFVGLRKSTQRKDRQHPFGYGQERYFWSFLAALGIFLVGGVLSVGEGVRSVLTPEPLESPWVGIGVLLVAAGFEGYSWQTAFRQLRRNAKDRGRSLVEHLDRASDPSAATVYLEDTAALIGIALALAALILHLVTGQAFWDGAASIAIGLLLMVVAWLLSRRSKALLVDESAPDDVLAELREKVMENDKVVGVDDLVAVFVGPAQLLVNTRVTLRHDLLEGPGADLVGVLAELRDELLRVPGIAEVGVSVTDSDRPQPDEDGRPALVEQPDGAGRSVRAGRHPAVVTPRPGDHS